MSSRTEETIQSSDGTKLFVRKWLPASKPIATLIVVHGFLEHGGRYREIAEYFASEHSISTIAYDLRGHGKSSGQRAYCSSMKDYFDDLEAALAYAKKNGKKATATNDETESTTTNEPPTPIFVFCHSFGGLTFLDYARERKVDIQGAIISAPFVAMAVKVPPIKVTVSKLLGGLLPRLSIPGEDLDLTHDAEKKREHDEDPLILHSVTLGWAKTCFNAQARVCGTMPLPLSMPILYLEAELDGVSAPDDVKAVGKNIEQKDKTIVVRKGDFHEMHNEVNRHEVYVLIAEWICNRLS
ncbi:hypothetical protein ACA910_009045 [Epithemia clementina (nom. ined.)]